MSTSMSDTHPPRPASPARPIVTCLLCHLAAGNSLGIRVRRFALVDSDGAPASDPAIGLGLCDLCIDAYFRDA